MHAIPTPTPNRTSRHLLVALFGICILTLLQACESVPAMRKSTAWQGQTPISASYLWGTLEAELPPGVRTESVLIAAKSELLRQGHVIDQSTASPQGGKLIALSQPGSPYSRVHIKTSTQPSGGVKLTINIDPDSESRTRLILDAILNQLAI
ncbi:MAG: hypothetical protein ACSHX5_06115 [Phycisphaerales bacterium]